MLPLGLMVLSAATTRPAAAAESVGPFGVFQAEQLEWRTDGDDSSFAWRAHGWIGGDDDKAWMKTEGEWVVGDELEEAEVQLLYSRRISDFFDLQVGGRYDVRPEPERAFAVLGLQGLAPFFIEVDGAGFVSDEGEVSARLELEYDLPITQRLILQPRFETNLAVQSVSERGVGSGLNDIELGLRIRYEVRRELAPYIGLHWERQLGETADLAREEGDDRTDLRLVAGLRFWF